MTNIAEVKSNRRRTTPIEKDKNKRLEKIVNLDIKTPDEYICVTCGKSYKKLDGNFPASQSELYAGLEYHLPTCKRCLDKLYEHYCIVLGDEDEAIRRVCMKYDIYYDQSLANASRKITKDRSRIHTYISRANLIQYKDKTYDTTIDSESSETIDTIEDIKKENKNNKVTRKTIQFFGMGYTEEEYQFLQYQYDDWTARHECKTKAQEELFKNICITQLQIQKATQKGDRIEQLMNAYQNLLGSANIKPNQTNENTLADQNTFGTLIKKWENEKPISEPDPEWKDVDGIRKYITVWFLGHLCKMMGIKNSYSQEYEDEIAKFKVEKPEYVDDEVNENYDLDDMFNDGV